MYPIGLTSIASHLERHGHNVRIINVAHRMLDDPNYNAEAAIAAHRAEVFGIDLHWLPHAHGALKLAEVVKRHHPRTPVVLGGLSSTYFHEELIRLPFVDFVMRGDSTEEPMLRLMRSVLGNGNPADVPNLTWKRSGGGVVVNDIGHVSSNLDEIPVPDVFYVLRSVFKYRSLKDVMPFSGWLNYPITALLTSRGCSMDCAVCGGSRSAYQAICNRARPAFRSPEALVGDIARIQRFSQGPIFLIHDLRHGGPEYPKRILDLLTRLKPTNEIVLELFSPVTDDYLKRVGAAVRRWSLEITLESHLERIRHLNRRFACSNDAIEHTVAQALENNVGRLDIFFMVGLPGQSYQDAIGCVDFCQRLLERFGGDRRLQFFVAPLAPFLDPGSAAFEKPEKFGYRLRFRTLEEHATALTARSWKEMLNYETEWMTRDEIVAATYEAMRRLARLKRDWGLIDQADFLGSVERIDGSERAVLAADDAPPPGKQTSDAAFRRFSRSDTWSGRFCAPSGSAPFSRWRESASVWPPARPASSSPAGFRCTSLDGGQKTPR
jgi:B12-binding domain/radical SAM domain protein